MNSFKSISIKSRQRGFTIVELLIVIVVIAVIATVSLISYSGVQSRTRDAIRTDRISKIKSALAFFKLDNGYYPDATPNPGYNGGWEASIDVSGTFMEYLKPYGFPTTTPIDPSNNTNFQFLYYKYGAGTGGCDATRGGFYVLMAIYEAAANNPLGNSMAAECTSPQAQWSNNTGTHYSFHSYDN